MVPHAAVCEQEADMRIRTTTHNHPGEAGVILLNQLSKT